MFNFLNRLKLIRIANHNPLKLNNHQVYKQFNNNQILNWKISHFRASLPVGNRRGPNHY